MLEFNHKNASKLIHNLVDEIFDYSCQHFGICEGDYPKVRVYMKDDNCYFEPKTNKIRIGIKYVDKAFYYHEYSHIKHDHDIGMFPCVMENEEGDIVSNWVKYVSAVVAHEMAHFVDIMTQSKIDIPENMVYYSPNDINDVEQREYHDARWQHIYRTLRNKFVNEI